ncbi:hypothetical protein DMX06_19355 [Pseudomonas mosselii]|nr:hypothetical protein DMX06_19355 [Pseudomonas mosselii]
MVVMGYLDGGVWPIAGQARSHESVVGAGLPRDACKRQSNFFATALKPTQYRAFSAPLLLRQHL